MKILLSIFVLLAQAILVGTLHAKESEKHIKKNVPSIPLLLERSGIPGLSLAIINSDGSYKIKNYGLEHVQEDTVVSDNTVFEAASLSKPVLSYITLKLIEDGELTLDTPLHTIYQEPRFSSNDYAKLLTPRLILSHQSGLPNWGGETLEFKFKPGTQFQYSGEGYLYLQKCLEKLSGLDYQSLAEREVFRPLKMKDSRFTWSSSESINKATGHNQAVIPQPREIPSTNAAASLNTTASDYAKFIATWFTAEVFSKNLRKEAFTTQVAINNESDKESSKAKSNKTQLGWGLGWGISTTDSSTDTNGKSEHLAWHWGDNGIFRAFTVLDLKNKRAMVYFANSQNGLSITKALGEITNFNLTSIVDWLGYGQSDTELWQAMFKGYQAEAKKDYVKAIDLFKKVVEGFPDNKRIANRIVWMETLLKSNNLKLQLSKAQLKALAGNYGDRKIELENGKLYYSRNSGKRHELKPLTENLFAVGEAYEFRLEAKYEGSKVTRLVGHYISGYSDQSARSD